MERCSCGRVAGFSGRGLFVRAKCDECCNTGVPDPFVNFPAGPRAPLRPVGVPAVVREILDEARHNSIVELNQASRLLSKLGGGYVHN